MTTKVRLLTGMVGRGVAHSPGDVVDLPTATADRLVLSRQAEYVDDPPPKFKRPKKQKSETAAMPRPE